MAGIQAVPAYAESSVGVGGTASASLRFAVRIPERIFLKTGGNSAEMSIKVAAVVNPGASVNVDANSGTGQKNIIKEVGGGSHEKTVIQADEINSVYTVASP